MNMLRQFLTYAMVLTLAVTAVSCGDSPTQGSSSPSPTARTASTAQNRLSSGQYPVQQATYNDADGEYTVMLLNTKPGESSAYRTTDLQMAQLTDEEISKGQKNYLKLDNNQASMHVEKDFKIDYVHNVTEQQTNPQTGQTERVIVRQESSFWSPFAGALAGQAIGSLLFRPQYYLPPVYQSGGIFGHASYGSNYSQAVSSYQQRYNAPPTVVRNRQTVRSTGNLRTPTTSTRRRTTNFSSRDRSTGAGYGTNTLRRRSSSPTYRQPSSSRTGFGSVSRNRSSSRRR